ncbi:hypothetical protein R1sor_010395 [Riccia sorocarpa]|uniref:FCP1 homology domain-containing protein n=1 Tax=Riccia sorocarpa TaxID=122646 RepID=A0ABD3I412_9MARC
MDVRLKERKAELAELERFVAEERHLLEETAHRRKEEERRLETLGANVYQPRLVDPESVRRKLLILAFDGLLVSMKSSAEERSEASQHGWDVLQVKKGCFVVVKTGLSEFSQACLRDFHLMIWTTRPRSIIDRILRFLFKSKKMSFDLAHHEVHDELPGVKKTKTWTDILFRICSYEERKSLREMWTGITVRHKARVESMERQKSPVDSATPVESAAPVESSTPVLTAARAAIDESSAPISSVVDEASVPSTS